MVPLLRTVRTTYLLDVPRLSAINGVDLTVVSRGSATLKKFIEHENLFNIKNRKKILAVTNKG